MSESAPSILIVDDDVELCDLFAQVLAEEGFAVETCLNGQGALSRIASRHFSLVILDYMLPGMNGLEVLKRVRAESSIPVLMLTARGSNIDRILGLELGADDYVSKPFDPREVVARIRAIIRRTGGLQVKADLKRFVDLSVNILSRTVQKGNVIVDLTAAEFDLLLALMEAPGRVVARKDLSAALGRDLVPFDRSIDMHVSNLRRKLGPGVDGLERVKTVRSFGYLLCVPVEDTS